LGLTWKKNKKRENRQKIKNERMTSGSKEKEQKWLGSLESGFK